ncbi:MAG TPA: zinc-binding dehydrogenase [Thermoanaerobaculia bacterium]|jgi:NADPH:quinone reductase-like Zn-dependent oxidoreductase
MKALVKGHSGLEFRDVDPPRPRGDELLIRVAAVSLNRGELRLASMAREGVIPGWDIAGTAVESGERVVGIVTGGGWAEYAVVPRHAMATIPEGVSFEAAATLPVAALTAHRALALSPILGRRVLITGATGGVGRFAIQLATMAGAQVTAVKTADESVSGEFDLILESVGGRSLARAVECIAPGGVVVTIGNSSEEDSPFNARTLFRKSGATIHGLLIFTEVEQRRVGARELAHLLELIRAGSLDPGIVEARSWREHEAVLADLEARKIKGKAVLRID